MLSDEVQAALKRSALGYVQRENAAHEVPIRIYELRQNIDRLEGREGGAANVREENLCELGYLEKLAEAMDVPTELPQSPAENEEPE